MTENKGACMQIFNSVRLNAKMAKENVQYLRNWSNIVFKMLNCTKAAAKCVPQTEHPKPRTPDPKPSTWFMVQASEFRA